MNQCEDAPCCGCCGISLYGNQTVDVMDEPDFYDNYTDPDDFGDDHECEDDHECDSCDGPGGMYSAKGVFTPNPGQAWTCSYCVRPCPEGAH